MCRPETAARSFPSPPTEIAFHTSRRFPWTHRRRDVMEQTGAGGVSAKQKEGQGEFLEAKLHESSTQSAELWSDSGVKRRVKSPGVWRCV